MDTPVSPVFLFDYRTVGASDGEPRNVIDPFEHRTDWLAAVEHVRSSSAVDGTRLGLWGDLVQWRPAVCRTSGDCDEFTTRPPSGPVR